MENKIKEIKKSNKKEFTRGVIITVCLGLASGLLGATLTKRLEEQIVASSLYAGFSKELNYLAHDINYGETQKEGATDSNSESNLYAGISRELNDIINEKGLGR